MRKILYIMVLITGLACYVDTVMAQAKEPVTISGVVTNAGDKQPVVGAHVLLMNRDERVMAHAVTDLNGNYSLRATPGDGDVIVVTLLGMKKSTTLLGNKTRVNVAMVEDSFSVDKIRVTHTVARNTGLMEIDEKSLTTATTTIRMSDVEDEVTTSTIDDVLQGRIAGLDITSSSGNPNEGMSMRIRGTSTISGSAQPLIVIDGFPLDLEISDEFDFAAADEEEYSQLLSISPSDIQDITILRDAAATAIWGSMGANGVLLITTKQGTVSKPRINYSLKTNVQLRPTGLDLLNGDEYITLMQDAYMNAGSYFNPVTRPEFALDVNQPYYYYNYGQNTDWFKAVTQTGFGQTHEASVQGGGEKATYRGSVTFYNQRGTVIQTNSNRLTALMNVSYNISKKIQLKASMSYMQSKEKKNYVNYLFTTRDVTDMAFRRMPNSSIWEYDDSGQLTGNYFSPEETPQGTWTAGVGRWYNPVAMAEDAVYNTFTTQIKPNLRLIYKPLTWLRYEFGVQMVVNNVKREAFLPQSATGRAWNTLHVNRADERDTETRTLSTENKLTFNPKLGKKHKLLGTLALSTYEKSTPYLRLTTSNSGSTYLQDTSVPARINGASTVGFASGVTETRSVRANAMVQYELLDRYIINLATAYEGSSSFGKDNRWGMFPSISGRWRVSGEPFMQFAKEWLGEFSIRASYGVTGKKPNRDYNHVSLYSAYETTYLGETGVYPGNLELSDLKWERSFQWNVGANLGMFKNRVTLDIDIYKKRSKDVIYTGLKIPTSTGFSKADLNSGVIDNQGFELSMNVVPVRNKTWTFSVNFNIAHNRNYIREISSMYSMEKGSSSANGDYIRRFELNQPLGAIYGYLYDGVYLNLDQTIARDKNGNKIYTYDSNGNREPLYMRFNYPSITYTFQPGDARYVDVNNDGNINYLDIVYLGNANPLFTGGISPRVKYKRLSVSTHFNFRYGNKVINSTKMNLESMRTHANQSKAVLKRWRYAYEDESEAPADLLPRALYGAGYNYLGSDRFVEDGSFLRFKSISVSYSLNKALMDRTFLNSCSFSLTLSNLWLWTKYTGQDPEVAMGRDPFRFGYDRTIAGRSPSGTLTVNISF